MHGKQTVSLVKHSQIFSSRYKLAFFTANIFASFGVQPLSCLRACTLQDATFYTCSYWYIGNFTISTVKSRYSHSFNCLKLFCENRHYPQNWQVLFSLRDKISPTSRHLPSCLQILIFFHWRNFLATCYWVDQHMHYYLNLPRMYHSNYVQKKNCELNAGHTYSSTRTYCCMLSHHRKVSFCFR